MTLTQLSPTELNAMLKADIIAAILEHKTIVSVSLTQREDGENVLLEETTTDAYGVLLGTRTVEWTYYVTGEVKNITVMETDAEDEVVGNYVIKHHKGRIQPVLVNLMPTEPILLGEL